MYRWEYGFVFSKFLLNLFRIYELHIWGFGEALAHDRIHFLFIVLLPAPQNPQFDGLDRNIHSCPATF